MQSFKFLFIFNKYTNMLKNHVHFLYSCIVFPGSHLLNRNSSPTLRKTKTLLIVDFGLRCHGSLASPQTTRMHGGLKYFHVTFFLSFLIQDLYIFLYIYMCIYFYILHYGNTMYMYSVCICVCVYVFVCAYSHKIQAIGWRLGSQVGMDSLWEKKWELNIKDFMGSNQEKYPGKEKGFFVMCTMIQESEK